MHFFNFKATASQRHYLDTTKFAYLTFWVRGTQGGEHIGLKLADAVWERKGDAVSIGPISRYLAQGKVTQEWQQVVIPFSAVPTTLNRKFLAGIVWEALAGQGQIEVKTLAFCREAQGLASLLPVFLAQISTTRTHTTQDVRSHITSTASSALVNKPKVEGSPPRQDTSTSASVMTIRPKVTPLRRVTWLWNTQPYLQDVRKQRELIAFLTQQGFDGIFVQIPHNSRQILHQKPSALNMALWRPFLAVLHRHNIQVFALDGYKKYALPTWHSRVLEIVSRVIEYNQHVFPHEMFDGVHFDIEPYLLSSLWSSRRSWLMSHYLQLLLRIRNLVHRHNMTLGVDIPFWWDEKDPYTQQIFRIAFLGKTKPLHEHVIDLADRIGIMDYRTEVFGADGVLTHAANELNYASQVKKQVLVGLETLPLPHEFLLDFQGSPRSGWPTQSDQAESYVFLLASSPVVSPSSVPTVSTSTASSIRRPHAMDGLRVPSSPPLPKTQTPQNPPQPKNTGFPRSFDAAKTGTLTWVPHAQLAAWKQRLDKRMIAEQHMVFWRVHRTQYVSPNKLSFANLGATRFRRALQLLKPELQRYPSFSGFAIHSLHSYQNLLKK